MSEKHVRVLWKRLHYRLWQQDQPLQHEAVCDQICALLRQASPANQMSLIAGFWATECREWPAIDRWRCDKFLMLVRRWHNACLQAVRAMPPPSRAAATGSEARNGDGVAMAPAGKQHWCAANVRGLVEVLKRHVVNPCHSDAWAGLKLHVADIYLDELMAVDDKMPPKIVAMFLEPYIEVIALTKQAKPYGELIAKRVFRVLIDQQCYLGMREELREAEGASFEEVATLAVDYGRLAGRLFRRAGRPDVRAANRRLMYALVRDIRGLLLNETPQPGEEEDNNTAEKASKKRRQTPPHSQGKSADLINETPQPGEDEVNTAKKASKKRKQTPLPSQGKGADLINETPTLPSAAEEEDSTAVTKKVSKKRKHVPQAREEDMVVQRREELKERKQSPSEEGTEVTGKVPPKKRKQTAPSAATVGDDSDHLISEQPTRSPGCEQEDMGKVSKKRKLVTTTPSSSFGGGQEAAVLVTATPLSSVGGGQEAAVLVAATAKSKKAKIATAATAARLFEEPAFAEDETTAASSEVTMVGEGAGVVVTTKKKKSKKAAEVVDGKKARKAKKKIVIRKDPGVVVGETKSLKAAHDASVAVTAMVKSNRQLKKEKRKTVTPGEHGGGDGGGDEDDMTPVVSSPAVRPAGGFLQQHARSPVSSLLTPSPAKPTTPPRMSMSPRSPKALLQKRVSFGKVYRKAFRVKDTVTTPSPSKLISTGPSSATILKRGKVPTKRRSWL